MALVLVFLSGFSALIYQVLWMKQIGLLFGNTSHATGATLSSFFAGLAVGSWLLGHRVSKANNPMRTYALLEFGIAITALLYFGILTLFHAIYPAIHQSTEPGVIRLLIKFALSVLLVFPPAFCMGGTIPVIGQYVVRESRYFGRLSALMYGINTLGAALGVGLAGFFLPIWLGYNLTCALAIFISLIIGVVALGISRRARSHAFVLSKDPDLEREAEASPQTVHKLSRQQRRRLEREQSGTEPVFVATPDQPAPAARRGRNAIIVLSFLSGFSVLALEVIWTRLFSQVLENSVYTFAAILMVVLLSLALGAIASSLISRLKTPPAILLSLLMLAGALGVSYTPHLFMQFTDGMQLITSKGNWSQYMGLILGVVALSIGPAAVVLGTLFPYLMKVEESHIKSPGLSLGQLASLNTAGAILGSLVCGFLLLDWLGVWMSMHFVAWLYVVAAIAIPTSMDKAGLGTKALCFAALIGVLLANPHDLPVTSTDPDAEEERVLAVWEGSDCTVSVTESQSQGVAIKVNSDYSLGSAGAYMGEKFQAHLPLFIKPDAEDIFFLGVGTGITAGSALEPRFPRVRKVVACELSADVITAARKYMTNYMGYDLTGGLFEDSRATVHIEDGRHYLMATDESFDIINSDLFVPFRSGAGSLYTVEHYASCKARLKPGGLFVQWLPLHQLTEFEFSVIAKSLLEVFDQVSMWRHNFTPGGELVALIGHTQPHALPTSEIDSTADKQLAVEAKTHHDLQRLNLPLDPQTITLFYAGNLGQARCRFKGIPLNTDNRPIIEYLAPRNYRNSGSDDLPWFVGEDFYRFVDEVLQQTLPSEDPLLANRKAANQRLPLAGHAFHRAHLSSLRKDEEATKNAWDQFVSEWTNR